MIDGKSDTPIANALILIEGDKIVSVTPGGTAPAGVEVIDLSQATVLPGLVDAHTHVLLQGDITEEDYDKQLLKQSIPYRAILAARNAQIALCHGFTVLRDLETEGAMYADVDVKNAIDNGEVPGPRMQVSTRAMTPTGMYALLGYSWEIKVPTGVQYVDGVEEARKAVREQIMYGADWIKYYSDHGYFYGPDGVLHSHVNFTDEEAKSHRRRNAPAGTQSGGARDRQRWHRRRATRGSGHHRARRWPHRTANGRNGAPAASIGFPRSRWARTWHRAARATGRKWWKRKRPRSNWR